MCGVDWARVDREALERAVSDALHKPGCASRRPGHIVGGISFDVNIPPRAREVRRQCDCRASKGITAAALALLAGCAHDPLPDAPAVLTEPLPVECPAAEVRTPDLALQAPLNLEPPALRDAPGDDYLISRQDAERTITALRACSERIDNWKAWASP